MLDIPSILLNKLNEKIQTIGNNANPRMDVIAQKAAKYLNRGSFLMPNTIRTGDSLGAIDICIRRENFMLDPTEIVMVYIEGGVAKVATLPYASKPTERFTYQYSIGPATDVACDFDGRFEFVSDHSSIYFDTEVVWALQTFGEPYIAVVNSGVLSIWQDETRLIDLVASDVVKCAIHRGWKSVSDVLNDQGVICAFTKSDTKAYYRSYCEQEDGTYIWEVEREITEFVTPVSNISMFRAADYRTGFLAEISGSVHLLLTSRAWSGMAITPDRISAEILSATLSITEINYADYKAEDEVITAGNYEATTIVFDNTMPVLRDAWNYDDGYGDFGKFIMVRWSNSVKNILTNLSSFKMVDSYNVSYYPSAIHETGYSNRLILEFVDFNNAANPANIIYTQGSLLWLDDALISSSSVTFILEGLIPTFIPAPIVTEIYNVEDWSET